MGVALTSSKRSIYCAILRKLMCDKSKQVNRHIFICGLYSSLHHHARLFCKALPLHRHFPVLLPCCLSPNISLTNYCHVWRVRYTNCSWSIDSTNESLSLFIRTILHCNKSNVVITRSNIVRHYVNDYRDWGRISVRCRIHKRHPIPTPTPHRPNGRAMSCLLWIFVRKLVALYLYTALYSDKSLKWVNAGNFIVQAR